MRSLLIALFAVISLTGLPAAAQHTVSTSPGAPESDHAGERAVCRMQLRLRGTYSGRRLQGGVGHDSAAHHPRQSLTGEGRDKVRITYAGTNFLDWRMDAATYDFNGGGRVSGFAVTCTSLTAHCITAGSALGILFEDLAVYGPGGMVNQADAGTSEAFLFQNTFNWMERWTLRRIDIGGFSVNLHFLKPAGGTDSFGYGNVDGVATNQGGTTRGVVVDPGAAVYNFTGWKYTFNLGFGKPGGAPVIFDVKGALRGVGFEVTGENSSVFYTFAHLTCGASMQVNGAFRVFGQPPVTVDPCPGGAITNGIPPYYLGPPMGPLYTAAGAGTIANWNNSGVVYSVVPTSMASVDYPSGAMLGYMYGANGVSAPLLAFDQDSFLCLQTHYGYSPINTLKPVWCADGGGNSRQQGVMEAGGVVAKTGFQVGNTPGFTGTVDSTKCPPVFHIEGGIITGVTCARP